MFHVLKICMQIVISLFEYIGLNWELMNAVFVKPGCGDHLPSSSYGFSRILLIFKPNKGSKN